MVPVYSRWLFYSSVRFTPMDDVQFIIESPQNNQGHKKRPRLVTSCDNWLAYSFPLYPFPLLTHTYSRLKKIKCQQPSPETQCEACKAAKIHCRFRDRERYFAERSRAIAGPGTAYGDGQRYYQQQTKIVCLHNFNNSFFSQTNGHPSLDAFSLPSTTHSSPASSHSTGRSSSYSPNPNGIVRADVEAHGRYQSYPPDPRRPMEMSHR